MNEEIEKAFAKAKLNRRFRYLSKLFFPRWDSSKWQVEIEPNMEWAGCCRWVDEKGYYQPVIQLKKWKIDLIENDRVLLHEMCHAVIIDRPLSENQLSNKQYDWFIGHGSWFHREKNRVIRKAEKMGRYKLAYLLDLDTIEYSMGEGRKEKREWEKVIEEEFERMWNLTP